MSFQLYLDTESDAFSEPTLERELARILREIAARIEREGVSDYFRTILDLNGNDVGRYGLKRNN